MGFLLPVIYQSFL